MSNQLIRTRIETLLRERGLKWVDIYKKLSWHKTKASLVFNGHFIPPLWQRVALARELNVDSTVIWDEPTMISAFELEKKQAEVQNDN